MNYENFIKKFNFPENFKAPEHLVYSDLSARPLTRHDLADDLEGVNTSLELIRKTRGGSWPSEAIREESDLLDLAWHEHEFRDGNSFAYVVYNNNNTYIGCFYLYKMGTRTKITEELLDYDIDASWWVTSVAYEQGYYEKLHSALLEWVKEFPAPKVYYSNKEIPS